MERVVIKPSRAKMLLLLGVGIGAAVLCLWMGFGEVSSTMRGPSRAVLAGVMVICGGFFGLGGLYALYRLFSPLPALVISAEGLVDSASMANAGFIAWNEIQEVIVHTYGNQKMLGIEVKDPQALLARLGKLKRGLLAANAALGAPLVNIPQIAISQPLEEVAEIMARFRQAYQPERAQPQED